MRPILILSFLFLLSGISSSNAQDSLQFKSGEWIVGRIIEIRKKEIQFRKKELPDGPDFVYNKSEIITKPINIESQNNINKTNKKKEKQRLDYNLISHFPYRKLNISFQLTSLIAKRITLQFEKYLPSYKESIIAVISPSFGSHRSTLTLMEEHNSTSYYFSSNYNFLKRRIPFLSNFIGNSIFIGLGYKYHFNSFNRVSFYLGSGIDGGYFKYRNVYKNRIYEIYKTDNQIGGITRINLLIGFKVNLSSRFYLSLGSTVSYNIYFLNTKYPKILDSFNYFPNIEFGINLGKNSVNPSKD